MTKERITQMRNECFQGQNKTASELRELCDLALLGLEYREKEAVKVTVGVCGMKEVKPFSSGGTGLK